ncbi:MAG: hypothetical protein AB1696_07025 [Planctomycetota bacterium]
MTEKRGVPLWFVWLAAVVAVGLMASSAIADKVILKSGNTFQGQIVEENDKQIVIEMQYGTMTFKKEDIKKVVKEKYTPPKPPSSSSTSSSSSSSSSEALPATAPRVTDEALLPIREYLSEADKALKVRNFIRALAALKKARETAEGSAPSAVSLIDAKIKAINEQALVLIEVKIDKVFVPEAEQDPAIRRDRNAPPVPDTEARKEAESSLQNVLSRVLQQKGFIVIEQEEAKKQRVQKLRATYSDSGGEPYRGPDGSLVGYRIHATCKLDLYSARGGVQWSESVEAATPYSLSGGTTRDGAMRSIEGQISALDFGIR